MSNRLRGLFLSGVATSITAGNPATLTLASGLNIAIPSGYYLPIILNPSPYVSVSGTSYLSEIVWTDGIYNAGTVSFTVLRAQEGTGSLGAQINIPYAIGPTPQDYGIVNWQTNGDFPTPTASGQILTSTTTGPGPLDFVNPASVSISGYQAFITISGNQVYGYAPHITISGNQVYGYLSNATISGTQIVGNLPTSIISGYYPNLVVSGGQVYGYLSHATISGSQITGFLNTVFTSPIETSYITSTAPNGVMNIYVTTNGTAILCTTAATANFYFNVASTNSTTLNSLLAVGQEITIAIKTTQGSTAYFCGSPFIQIDGTTTNVTVYWQGGNAPTKGNASGIDAYVLNITKTANATYTVLASQARF